MGKRILGEKWNCKKHWLSCVIDFIGKIGEITFEVANKDKEEVEIEGVIIPGYGGVGYYPMAGFVHIDSGRFRSW